TKTSNKEFEIFHVCKTSAREKPPRTTASSLPSLTPDGPPPFFARPPLATALYLASTSNPTPFPTPTASFTAAFTATAAAAAVALRQPPLAPDSK
ncbi:Uncharacterized protein DBV15_09231, partial [Temnothorax longispinosus]